MPARPPAQAAPEMEGRPAPRRDLPVDHPGRAQLRPPNPPGTRSSRRGDGQDGNGLRFAASRWWGGAVMAGPGDEIAAAEGRGRGDLRASHADREQVISTLKAAFVQGMLAKDEFDQRVGQAFASRTYAELAALTADLPVEPIPAQPPKPARAQGEQPVLRPGPVLAVATAALCRRMGVHVPPALAYGFRGRSPARNNLAGLLDHHHLPARSGHSCGEYARLAS